MQKKIVDSKRVHQNLISRKQILKTIMTKLRDAVQQGNFAYLKDGWWDVEGQNG